MSDIKKFEVGDKVKLVNRGAIGWESHDYTELAKLNTNDIYTVLKTYYNQNYGDIMLKEDRLGIYFHPNHFEKIK